MTDQEREALEFYADPAQWDGAAEAIWHDSGARARAALIAREEPTNPIKAKAAARAVFDFANESDEYSDRFETWWANYLEEEFVAARDEDRIGELESWVSDE